MKKYIVTYVIFLFSTLLFSQNNNFVPTKRLKIILRGETNIPNVLIKLKTRIVRVEKGVTKSDKWINSKSTFSSLDGSFFFELAAHTNKENDFVNYGVEFSKKEFITKKILLNTYVPLEEYKRNPFEKYDYIMDVTMLKSGDSTFVGKISWDISKHALGFSKVFESAELKIESVSVPTDTLFPDSIKVSDSETSKKIDSLKRYSVSGNFYINDEKNVLENARVNLLNSTGKIVQVTTTNFLGSYTFEKLISGEDYTISLDAVSSNITINKIIMTNSKGEKMAESNGSAIFKYKLLAPDENTLSPLIIEDENLKTGINGKLFSDSEKKIPLANVKLFIENAERVVVGNAITDKTGSFHFANLSSDKNYLLVLDEKDPLLNQKEVVLADNNGVALKKLKSKEGQFFKFDFLSPEASQITSVYVDDPWLKIAEAKGNDNKDITVIENIYYDFADWELFPEAKRLLNKPIEAMKRNPHISIELLSHTDSKGSSLFNIRLSQKRANETVEYFIANGISKERINGKGMGEEKLINHCKDDVPCTEKENAQNRRTEFIVKYINK